MTVWGADVGPDANQKVHDVVVAPADGVVKGGDAFVVGLARVSHLRGSRAHRSGHGDVSRVKKKGRLRVRSHLLHSFLHRLQFADQRAVQGQDVGAEPGPPPRTLTFLSRPPEDGTVALRSW